MQGLISPIIRLLALLISVLIPLIHFSFINTITNAGHASKKTFCSA